MITKFKSIKNLAVFQNYDWDKCVLDNGGNVVLFKDINIIYGRNYSGKTTLSRIIRSLEQGLISLRYENPEFVVTIKDIADATQSNLIGHGKKIRVFNEDFVKENLKFILNSEDSITPFAILGGNASIEEEIKSLKNELGENNELNESGFYLELKIATSVSETAQQTYEKENNKLNQQLSSKATNNPDGIKYKSERYGDQNYTKPKLENDISIVLESSFLPLTDEEISLSLSLINESVNPKVQNIQKITVDYETLNNRAKQLIEEPISSSDKISRLINDSILNRWVKEGRQLHKEKIKDCSFCGNIISEERWSKLDSHFDEESEKLEQNIGTLINEIDAKILSLDSFLLINKSIFYSKFHNNLDRLIIIRNKIIDATKLQLNQVRESLNERKDDLLNPHTYSPCFNNSRLEWIWALFENLRLSANLYSSSLGIEQNDTKKLLRLREVSDFVKTIQYSEEIINIQELKQVSATKALIKNEILLKIHNHLRLIRDNERLMNDEEKGALKVNEYLNSFFGHNFLTLQALEEIDHLEGKKIRFEIIRNNQKAHHLSEGECSLIAFCYFMAKLEDIDTKGSKPIIWIDDPISSLDSNHIFFVYSLINSEIVMQQNFEQLFISTHNLDFLKYLKRLPNRDKTESFIISRGGDNSQLKIMPKYLKDYVTEFNFLFHQIYLCAYADANDELQHSVFYNFGNNARKFLEALLFYKYPSRIENQTMNSNTKRLLKYFGADNQATVLTERVNNELSHLEEIFDRGMVPIDIPEITKVAKFILEKMESNDIDQYEALLESIGVLTTN